MHPATNQVNSGSYNGTQYQTLANLEVVAGGAGDNAVLLLLRRQVGDLVMRAAQVERERRLHVLLHHATDQCLYTSANAHVSDC